MKIVHPLLDEPIVFTENQFPVWVLEGQTTFSALIAELKQQIDNDQGLFVLSEGMDIISLRKYAELIINPFALQLNNRTILGRLYKRLEKTSLDEIFYQQTAALRTYINTYLDELFTSETLPLHYKDSFEITQLLKNIELQIDWGGQSIAEMLPDYLKAAAELSGIKLFVFVNLKCFLSSEELTGLYTYASYEKLDLLLLENTYKKPCSPHEKTVLLDSDFCRLI